MTTNPIYTFEDVNELGINEIPDNVTVIISDSDGSGTPKQVQKIANTDLTETSTIADFLANDTLFKSAGAAAPEYTTIVGGTY